MIKILGGNHFLEGEIGRERVSVIFFNTNWSWIATVTYEGSQPILKSLCVLCVLRASAVSGLSNKIHHGNTENTEAAQRKADIRSILLGDTFGTQD